MNHAISNQQLLEDVATEHEFEVDSDVFYTFRFWYKVYLSNLDNLLSIHRV